MAYGSVNVDKMTTSDGISSAGVYGFKNRLINGNFAIDQRNAGASATTYNVWSVDRWWINNNTGASRFSWQQNAGSVTPPVGFTNYLGVTSSSAYSVTATNVIGVRQPIEGFNTADLAWGTANAKTVTLSFQVYSSLTGTFGGSVLNSANNRSYPFTYTVSSANTWTPISITIVGDTSGTWLTNNGIGLDIYWNLGTGSTYSGTAGSWAGTAYYSATGATSVVGTNGATFYITGTQLEVGSTATSFDYRPYGTELALCQRYCQVSRGSDGLSNNYVRIGNGPCQNSQNGIIQYKPLVTFRTQPSLTASGSFAVYDGVTVTATTGVSLDAATTAYLVVIAWSVSGGGMTAPRLYEYIIANSSTTTLTLSAEL